MLDNTIGKNAFQRFWSKRQMAGIGQNKKGRLVETYHCGIVVEPGNSDELVKAISRLSNDAEGTAAMGRRARAMLESQFTRRRAFEQ
jgi:glycosyltransferase involved in cell wall biosynthesis